MTQRTSSKLATRTIQLTRRFAWALLISVGVLLAMQVTILAGTAEITIGEALGGDYAIAQSVRIVGALLMLALLHGKSPSMPLLLALALVDLGAGVATSHAAARIEDRGLLIGITALHHAGAAVWIGGLPCFLSAMRRLPGGAMRRQVGARYSLSSMLSVGAIAFSGIGMLVYYVGSVDALYGTAYGMMLATKITLFFGLLALGFGNFRVVRSLAINPGCSILCLRRFAEVELGVGITIFFVAASMTSLPPAIDLTRDRVSLRGDRGAAGAETAGADQPEPRHPRLLRRAEDARRRKGGEHAGGAAGLCAGRRRAAAAQRAGHRVVGIQSSYRRRDQVLVMGVLVLLEKTGKAPWARHWPLLLIVLAGFLFLRSEAEGWPTGSLSLAESLRDPEFIQHKSFMVLMTAFAGFRMERTATR